MNMSDELLLMARGQRLASASCFGLARRSLRAAAIQVDRIWAERPQSPDHFEDMLIDIHFYFIALRNVYRFLDKFCDDPTFKAHRPALDKLNERWFRHFAAGREAFEHIDQRLPGERHAHRIEEINAHGARRRVHYGVQPSAGLFLHSTSSWDIKRETFAELARETEEFMEAALQHLRSTVSGV